MSGEEAFTDKKVQLEKITESLVKASDILADLVKLNMQTLRYSEAITLLKESVNDKKRLDEQSAVRKIIDDVKALSAFTQKNLQVRVVTSGVIKASIQKFTNLLTTMQDKLGTLSRDGVTIASSKTYDSTESQRDSLIAEVLKELKDKNIKSDIEQGMLCTAVVEKLKVLLSKYTNDSEQLTKIDRMTITSAPATIKSLELNHAEYNNIEQSKELEKAYSMIKELELEVKNLNSQVSSLNGLVEYYKIFTEKQILFLDKIPRAKNAEEEHTMEENTQAADKPIHATVETSTVNATTEAD